MLNLKACIAVLFLQCLTAGPAQAATATAAMTAMGLTVSTYVSDTASGTDIAAVGNPGFFAPFGPNNLGEPPNSAYPIRYAGMAEADAHRGRLRASFSADPLSPVLFRGGEAVASISGQFVLTGGAPGDPTYYSFSLGIDGTVQGSAAAEAELRITSVSDPRQTWTTRYDSPPVFAEQRLSVEDAVRLNFFGRSGETYTLSYSLRTWANTQLDAFSQADFSQTATLTLLPQSGSTLTGVDGFLAAAPLVAVPEPTQAATLALGLVLLYGRLRAMRGATRR